MTEDLPDTKPAEAAGKTERADKEWDDLQRDLDTLGEQVKALRDHAGALGEAVLGNIELRFQDVLSRAHAYRNTTQAELADLQKRAMNQAQNTITETGKASADYAKETARQMWERSEPIRQGAQEVGQGFLRAWSELAASFGKAAEKVQAEKAKAADAEENAKPGETRPT